MKKFLTLLCASTLGLCAMGSFLAVREGGEPATSDGSNLRIVGSLLSGTNVTEADRGLYSFDVTAPDNRTLVLQGPVASYGGVVIDGIYYCNTKTSWMGMFNFYEVYRYDLSTGEGELYYDEDDATAYFSQGGMNLDPISGSAIGIFYDSEMYTRQLALVSYTATGPIKTILAELSDPSLSFNAFAVDGEGGCWAIAMDGDLYSINRQSGNCVNIGPTGFVPSAIGSAVIDTASGKMYWTLAPADGTGRLIEVDLTTGAGTQKAQFSDNAQWGGLYIPEEDTDPNAPGLCTDLAVEFPEGSMQGTLTFKVPADLYNGNPGSGELTVSSFVNGINIDTRNVSWGENVTVNVNLDNYGPGWFEFMVYASNNAGKGPRTKLPRVWIGNDTPLAPVPSLSYVNDKMTVSWEEVSESTNGGYIDPSAIRYTVYDKDTTLIADDIAALTYDIPITPPAPATAKSYQYIVQASIGTFSSGLAKSNTIALGELVPPFEADFSKPGLDAFTILDENNDGIEWSLYNESPVGISIHYNEDIAMDDWLISPPLQLEAGKAYAVSFCTYSMESYYAERIEVKWGNDNTAAAMTETILPPTDLPNMRADAFRYSKYICPQVNGRYFIGFHGISDKDKFDLILSEFSVADAISAACPSVCTDISIEPDAGNVNKAVISFKVPSTDIAGNNLTESVNVDIYRNGELAKTFTQVPAGSVQSFEDTVPESGEITYRFVPSNSYGSGEEVTATAYIGYHAPIAPSFAEISRTDALGEVSLQWGEVIVDVDGMEYPEGSISYDIYPAGANSPVATGIQANSYTFIAVQPGQQEMVGYEVKARYGSLLGEPAYTATIPVGTPYSGLHETGEFGSYVWGVSSAGGASWSLMDDTNEGFPGAYDGDGTYFGCSGTEAGDFGVLFSGLVSLENIDNPSLTFATYHIEGSEDRNEIGVSVKLADSDEWEDIWKKNVSEVAPVSGEWGMATIPLSMYAGKVIQVQFSATCISYLLTLIDGITISKGLGLNLAIASIKAPLRAVTGTNYNVEVDIENTGAYEADNFEVNLYADDILIESRQIADLSPLNIDKQTFTVSMSALAEQDVTLRAEVVYADDENASDNISREITVAPKDPGYPRPTSLTGAVAGSGIQLNWSKPDMGSTDGQPITEDFEDATSFSDTYGSWTFVDVDKSPVGGLSNTDIPGIISRVTLGSFWIWDTDVLPIGGSGTAHSGSKYLFSLYRFDNNQSDDWAISPELNGDEQTISFWARSYSGSYPEHIQVMVSATGVNTEDFVMLEDGDIQNVPNAWTKYEFLVPAGTKHFAIRNYAVGAFMLMIDDVTYIPAPVNENLSLTGYNVYRNGDRIATSPAGTTSWIDLNVESGQEYVYQITAEYENVGESGASNKVSVGYESGVSGTSVPGVKVSTSKGAITVLNPDGIPTRVYNSDGILINSAERIGKYQIEVLPGVYILRAGNQTFKVLVP